MEQNLIVDIVDLPTLQNSPWFSSSPQVMISRLSHHALSHSHLYAKAYKYDTTYKLLWADEHGLTEVLLYTYIL